MRTKEDWIKGAYVYMNRTFINIGTYSGYGMYVVNPEDPEFFFDLGSSDVEVGNALLTALDNSRLISPEETTQLRINETNYPNWVKHTIKAYHFKTKGEMFKPMFYCDVRKQKTEYLFYPTHQRALEAWEGNEQTKKQQFTIPLMATAVEMGAALRRCLALCTSKFDPSKDA